MTTYPIFILSADVKSRGETGTSALKMRFRDASKIAPCSYCECLTRNTKGRLFCDPILRLTIETKQIGLNCAFGANHIYRYSDDPELVPYGRISQVDTRKTTKKEAV